MVYSANEKFMKYLIILISTFLFLQTSSYSKLTGGGLAAPIIDKVNEWRQDLFILGCVLVAMGILMAVISNYMEPILVANIPVTHTITY